MSSVRLAPWGDDDGPLLARLLGDARMMEHLGGPESAEKIADRQRRYAAPESDQYRIVADGAAVGYVGFFERPGHPDWEMGWSVLPEYQGRGIARRASALLVDVMRRRAEHHYVHAYPSVKNGPSNAICARLGFELRGASSFEYPAGHFMRCNDWRLDLGNDAVS